MSEAIKILSAIQYELKAPKNQLNSFGKYKYRSCEDILEGVKPLLDKHDAAIIVSDSIEAIGDRIYVKATATIHIGSEKFSSTAFAREAENKKGMDSAQVTGSTSSYARKYALNGLLCIDDTKDADSGDNSQQKGKAEIREQSTETTIDHTANYKLILNDLTANPPGKVDEILDHHRSKFNAMPPNWQKKVTEYANKRKKAEG